MQNFAMIASQIIHVLSMIASHMDKCPYQTWTIAHIDMDNCPYLIWTFVHITFAVKKK